MGDNFVSLFLRGIIMNKVSREDFNRVMRMYPELNSATSYECGAWGTPILYEDLDEYVDSVYDKNVEHCVTGHDIVNLIIDKLGGDNISKTKQTYIHIGRDEFNRVLLQYIKKIHGAKAHYLRVNRGILIMGFVLAGYTQDPCNGYIKINISKKLYQKFVEEVDMWDYSCGTINQRYEGVIVDSMGVTYKNLREASQKSKIPLYILNSALRYENACYGEFRRLPVYNPFNTNN